RHQHRDIAANHLGSCVTKQPLRRRVHAFYDPVLIDGDDRVGCGAQDRLNATLALAQRIFCFLTKCDVTNDASELPVITSAHLAEREFNGKSGAVAAQRFKFAADSYHSGLSGADISFEISVVLVAMR